MPAEVGDGPLAGRTDTGPRTSKLAAAGFICFVLAIPSASIAVGSRGADQDWLSPVGSALAGLLLLSSVLLSIAAVIVILLASPRPRGIGLAVTTVMLNAAAITGLAMLIFSAAFKR